MSYMSYFILFVAIILVAIRFAPTSPKRWHVPLTHDRDKTLQGGALKVVEGADLTAFDAAKPQNSKTIAGSVEEGRITYEVRTRWIGFPDYITAEQHGDTLKLFSRLRFGRNDFGVNAARLSRWLERMAG